MRAIILTKDEQLKSACSNIAQSLNIDWVFESEVPEFLLGLQTTDYRLIMFDCERCPQHFLKWLEHIIHLRPKIPVIPVCTQVKREIGAQMMNLGVYYIAQKPLDENTISSILSKMQQ